MKNDSMKMITLNWKRTNYKNENRKNNNKKRDHMKKLIIKNGISAQMITQKRWLKSDDNSQKLDLKTRGMARKVGQW